jgi:hypothetical protein
VCEVGEAIAAINSTMFGTKLYCRCVERKFRLRGPENGHCTEYPHGREGDGTGTLPEITADSGSRLLICSERYN